jgi:hypothetical protein
MASNRPRRKDHYRRGRRKLGLSKTLPDRWSGAAQLRSPNVSESPEFTRKDFADLADDVRKADRITFQLDSDDRFGGSSADLDERGRATLVRALDLAAAACDPDRPTDNDASVARSS